MNSSKNLALVVLIVAAVGGGVLAYRQQLELQSLRVAAANREDSEALKRRALAAERRAKELGDELAAAQDKLNEAKTAVVKTEAPKRPDESAAPGPNIRTMMSSAANMMNRPEMQRMMAMSQKAGLDTNYAKLFKQLNLAPEKLEQFKKLMVERQSVANDVFSAAVEQGLDPVQGRREIVRMTGEAQGKVDGEIRSLLGDADFSSYQGYQATLPQRGVVNQVQQSLSYTPTPLTDQQAEQLVQILAQNPVARPAGAARAADQTVTVSANRTMVVSGSSTGGGGTFVSAVAPGMMGLGNAPVSDAAVAASRSVLSEPQVAALQQVQQQQTQMNSVMQTMGGQPGQGGVGVFRFETASSTSSTGNPPPPPSEAGTKPPGGE